jgi:hypothetical protein
MSVWRKGQEHRNLTSRRSIQLAKRFDTPQKSLRAILRLRSREEPSTRLLVTPYERKFAEDIEALLLARALRAEVEASQV